MITIEDYEIKLRSDLQAKRLNLLGYQSHLIARELNRIGLFDSTIMVTNYVKSVSNVSVYTKPFIYMWT